MVCVPMTVVEGSAADSRLSVVDCEAEVEVAIETAGTTVVPAAVWVTVLVAAPTHWLLGPHDRPVAQQPPPREDAHDVASAGQLVATTVPAVTVVVEVK